MADPEETLVMRRPKRSTAGNRMEAALAEFLAEDIGVDAEEDVDFTVERDEEDAFESDFESTDEEAVQADVDAAAEKFIREEERSVRKTARSKLEKVTAIAHARQKATFNPEIQKTTNAESSETKLKRRVSLGVVIDAETGEVMERAKRQSTRSHTMLNTSATVSRMKDEKEKKSTLPKKVKPKMRAPTQDELIARALDMEEGNVAEHRNYLTLEEEKRKRARLVRTAVQGPLLRWVSKGEEIKVMVNPQLPPEYPHYGHGYNAAQPANAAAYPIPPPSTSYLHPLASSSSGQPVSQSTYSHPQSNFVYQAYIPPVALIPVNAPSLPPEPVERTEKVAKNYVVHELSQTEKGSRPPWHSTMKAMFGDHVKWEDLRVYTTKGRPFTRPTQMCPISGRPARYRDPRTGVPFADLEAYETLTKVLAHEYVWSDSLGCYVGQDGFEFP